MDIEEAAEVYENDETVFALPENSQLDESFTDKLRAVCKWLGEYRSPQAVYQLAVKKIMKMMVLTPELEPFALYPDECSKNLLELFAALSKTVDESFKINDFYSFCCYNERILTFRTQKGYECMGALFFAVLTAEFCRLIEQLQAFGVFYKIDAGLTATTGLPAYFENIKFGGLTFLLYWKLKGLLLRMTELSNAENARQKLTDLGVIGAAEEIFELRALRKLTDSIPGYYENDKMMFCWARGLTIFTPYFEEPSPEMKNLAGTPMFNPEHILTAMHHRRPPELRTFDNVPKHLRQPSDADINNIACLIAANAFKSPRFQEFLTNDLDKSLRLNTTPPVSSGDHLSIYSKVYPLKRLGNVALKKANNYLLYQLAKCQISDEFVISYQSYRNFKKFKDSAIEAFREGYYVTEESMEGVGEDLRRLNRRYNKIFDKAFGHIVDDVIRLYSGFYFEQAVRRQFMVKAVKGVSAIGRQLCTVPEWKSIRRNETVNRDANFGVYAKMLTVIAEIEKPAAGTRMKLSFWKGLKKYDERVFEVAKLDFADNIFELATNVPLSSLINDFQPNVLVIVADCPEAYLLRPKINCCIHLATMEGKHGQIKEPMSLYFFESQMLDSLTASSVNWSRGQVYNCFLQNPLLTFLTLFRSDLSEKRLFNERKVDLKNDLCRFMLKMSVLESVFEKGISFGDLLATRHAPQLLQLLGLTATREQLRERWQNMKADVQVGVLKFNVSKCQAWYRFNKKNAPDPSFVLFNSAPESEIGFTLIKNAVDSYSTEQVKSLKSAIDKVLKSSSSEVDFDAKRLLSNLLPNSDYITNALNLRRVMIEFRYARHMKVSTLSETLRGDANELKTARKVFKNIIDLRKDVLVEMTVLAADNAFVTGTIAGIFHGSLHCNDIDFGVKINEHTNLEKYFSANEKINVIINNVSPEILRLDVSLQSNFGLRMNRYLDESGKLQRYGIKRGVNFTADPKTDFPLAVPGVRKERNFDYFPAESNILRNWNLKEAKSRLRETKEDKFVFKPSQRGKHAYFDLVIYMSAIDSVFTLPVEQMNYDETGAARVNLTPKKYVPVDMNALLLSVNSQIYEGLGNLVSGFVKPLMTGLKVVIEHVRYKTAAVDVLIENLKTTLAMTPQTDDEKPAFWLTKNPTEDLQFEIVYRDALGNFGSKGIKVGPGTFELGSKFEKFEFLISDFLENWKEERFRHQTDAASNLKVVSIVDENVSVLSVSDVEDALFHKSVKMTALRAENGQQKRYHGQGSVAYGGGGTLESGEGGNWVGPRRPRTEQFGNERPQNRYGNDRNERRNPQNFSSTAATTGNAPSWGNAAAQSAESNIPSWGVAPTQTQSEAMAVPAWGNPPAQTETANAPTWGTTPAPAPAETPGWGNPPVETPAVASWGNTAETPKTAENTANTGWNAPKAEDHQSGPRNNDFRGNYQQRNQGFGQRDGTNSNFQNRQRLNNNANQRGPRQFNDNRQKSNTQAQNQPSWGNTAAATNTPSWGAPAAKSDSEVPSWGAPAPEVKTDEAPAWGAAPPITAEAKAPEVSGWGAPPPAEQPAPTWSNSDVPKSKNTGNSWNSCQNQNLNNRPPRDNYFNNRPPRDNNWNNRPPRDNNLRGKRRNFGDQPNRYPPRDKSNANAGNSWGNNNNSSNPANNAPSWGNTAESQALAVPSWGATQEQTAVPVASWGNSSNEQSKTAETAPSWGATEAPKAENATADPITNSSNWNNNRGNDNGGNWQSRSNFNGDRPQRNFNDRPPRNNNYGAERPQSNNFNRNNFQDRNNSNFRRNSNNWNQNRSEGQSHSQQHNNVPSWGNSTAPPQVTETVSWGAPKNEDVAGTKTHTASWGAPAQSSNNEPPVAAWGAPDPQKTEETEAGEIRKPEATEKVQNVHDEHKSDNRPQQRNNWQQGRNNRERGNFDRNNNDFGKPRAYNQNDGGRGGWNGGNRNSGGEGGQQRRGHWNAGQQGGWGGNREGGQRQNWNRGQHQNGASNSWNSSASDAPRTENVPWGAPGQQQPAPAWGVSAPTETPAPAWDSLPPQLSLSKRESPDFPVPPDDSTPASNHSKLVKDKLLTEPPKEEGQLKKE